ncbi:tyrosine-type recombinase/integrase [Corallococcus silvisoli]|uniref:tyrosine-type recombinase/integrase n=1 Tax=Corallococcus silvisoli TaxID=2697031 RepID=UPI00191C0B8B|nr:tyrosine-type recombinase/integrase [Corallococcus silvisoli]
MRSLIELPRVYAAAHQKGDQNDLLQIAGVVGTLGGALAPVAGRRRVYPRGWKDTLGADRFTVLAHSPDVKHFKVKKPDYDFLAFEEVDRLLAAASPENVALLTTAPKPGLRQEERIGLRWQDVDLTRARLHVKRPPVARRRRHSQGPQHPGGGPSTIRRGHALKGHRHLRGPFVFCQENGVHPTPGMMDHLIITTLKRAGITRGQGTIGWHDLRRTYGSTLS